jgi:predicted protein tyrosine phosphatase
MERRHADILSRSHPEAVEGLHIVNLRIPDEFELDDPSLIRSLREAVAAEFGTEP